MEGYDKLAKFSFSVRTETAKALPVDPVGLTSIELEVLIKITTMKTDSWRQPRVPMTRTSGSRRLVEVGVTRATGKIKAAPRRDRRLRNTTKSVLVRLRSYCVRRLCALCFSSQVTEYCCEKPDGVGKAPLLDDAAVQNGVNSSNLPFATKWL